MLSQRQISYHYYQKQHRLADLLCCTLPVEYSEIFFLHVSASGKRRSQYYVLSYVVYLRKLRFYLKIAFFTLGFDGANFACCT